MTHELRAKIRRMIENETRPTNLPPSAYWTLATHVKQLLDELDKDEKADSTATAWLDLIRPGPSIKVEFADEDDVAPGDRVRHKSTGAVGMVGVGTHWKDANRHLVHWNSTRPSTFETSTDLEKI
jgi:hypothetical protein